METTYQLLKLLGKDLLPLNRELALDQRAAKLARLLRTTPEITDALAAELLGLPPGQSGFRKVKQRLHYALINGITAIGPGDHSGEDDRQRLYDSAWKHLSLGHSYQLRSLPGIAEGFLKSALKVARENDMPRIAALAAEGLRDLAVAPGGRIGDYPKYHEICEREWDRSRALELVNSHAVHLGYLRANGTSPTEIEHYLEEAIAEIATVPTAARTLRTMVLITHLKMVKDQMAGHFSEAITRGEKLLTDLAQRPAVLHRTRWPIENDLAINYYLSGNYRACEDYANRLLQHGQGRGDRAVRPYEFMLLLGLRQGRFADAYGWYLRQAEALKSARLSDSVRENLTIVRAYLQLLFTAGAYELPAGTAKPGQFRVGHFVNSCPLSSREKDNRNIHLLILPLLHYCLLGRQRGSFDGVEATERYLHRHLAGEHTRRSKIFLRMLLQLPKHDFNRAAVRRATEPLLGQLREAQPAGVMESFPRELVDYERLWEMIRL